MNQHTVTPTVAAQETITTTNEPTVPINYEVAYFEMRNIAAFIINVIAGEIGDELIVIDDEHSLSEQKRLEIRQVLHVSSSLVKRSVPSDFKAHDEILDSLLECLKNISCEDVANVKHFGMYHDSRL